MNCRELRIVTKKCQGIHTKHHTNDARIIGTTCYLVSKRNISENNKVCHHQMRHNERDVKIFTRLFLLLTMR